MGELGQTTMICDSIVDKDADQIKQSYWVVAQFEIRPWFS